MQEKKYIIIPLQADQYGYRYRYDSRAKIHMQDTSAKTEIHEIERLLRVNRVTVADFLESAGVPSSTWHRIKRGQVKTPKPETMERVRAEVARRNMGN